MKTLVIGATGNVGACVVNEAVSRGHDVTAVSRHSTDAGSLLGVHWVAIDAGDGNALTTVATVQDAMVCAISPWSAGGRDAYLAVIRSVLTTAGKASVGNVLFSGGGSSLMLPDGRRVLDVQREQARDDEPHAPHARGRRTTRCMRHTERFDGLTLPGPSWAPPANLRTARDRAPTDQQEKSGSPGHLPPAASALLASLSRPSTSIRGATTCVHSSTSRTEHGQRAGHASSMPAANSGDP